MRVAIEAAPLSLSSGGLRRYAAEISLALADAAPGRDRAALRPAAPSSEARRRTRRARGARQRRRAALVAVGRTVNWAVFAPTWCTAPISPSHLPRHPSVLTCLTFPGSTALAAVGEPGRTPVLLRLGWQPWC
jgi:hypothetical protein